LEERVKKQLIEQNELEQKMLKEEVEENKTRNKKLMDQLTEMTRELRKVRGPSLRSCMKASLLCSDVH
jgi:UDP-glucose 6-dehydrogenase